MKVALLPVLTTMFLFTFTINVQAATIVYDDFSGPSLNTSKWTEWTDAAGYPTEHYVNTTEGRFHIVQDEQSDSEHRLTMTREMNSGEVLSYELYYNSGDGNRIHRMFFDGEGIQNLIGCSNCGAVGFWNTNASAGTDFGKYSMRYEFYDDTINATVVRPDDSVWNAIIDISSLTAPYEIWLATGTGHNGIMHFDIDNVKITTEDEQEPPEPPESECDCTELKEELEELEEKVYDIEDRTTAVEDAVSALSDSISFLQNNFESFRDLIIGYVTNTPLLTKRSMICGYMTDNDIDEHEALGLSCSFEKTGWSRWSRNVCKCKPSS